MVFFDFSFKILKRKGKFPKIIENSNQLLICIYIYLCMYTCFMVERDVYVYSSILVVIIYKNNF